MKQKFKLLIFTFIAILFSVLILKIAQKVNYKQNVKEKLKTIPSFTFIEINNNQSFTNQSLQAKEATVFFYFNTTCDYCQHEAEMVKKNLTLFKNTNLVFVSNEESTVIKEFAKNYQLSNIQNVTFLQDKQDVFATNFDATSIPYVLIYNKSNQLVKAHKGQIKPDTIIELLQL